MASHGFPETKFWQRFRGGFSGVLKWQDLENMWVELKSSPENWYVFDPAGNAPATPASKTQFLHFLDEAEMLINQRRDRPSCGAVYVDDMKKPTYIKVFDPASMGSSCSCSAEPVMPRWIVSHMVPDTLPPPPVEKPSLFQRLTGRA